MLLGPIQLLSNYRSQWLILTSFCLQFLPEAALAVIPLNWYKRIVEHKGYNAKNLSAKISSVTMIGSNLGVGVGYLVGGFVNQALGYEGKSALMTAIAAATLLAHVLVFEPILRMK